MPRFRKYRVFLVFAAILVFTLYNFWQPGPGASFGNSQSSGDGKPAQNGDRDGAKVRKPVVDIQGIAHAADPLPGATSAKPTDDDDPKTIHWRKPTEYYPLAAEDLIHLPSGTPKKMPRIQFEFPVESAEARKIREGRRDKVKAEFLHAWKGYKKHAWGHDEVGPVNGGSRDPFCGWAATMVDSLDTLWIMGLKDEFEEALKSVKKIDFTTSPKSSIPVFETTIRYLGGLLAAYDISDKKYPVLLTKATELGEILMSIFDTPNRMPVLHYGWQPHTANERHRAAGNSNFAELGSLSVEFTRLAQLTGEHKYYDAVARITNALVEWQESGTTEIKGIFPDSVDASGCNSTFVPDDEEPAAASENSAEKALRRRDNEAFCRPQGLTKGPSRESYSMGGGQDSTYEYFSKMWLLLGGLDTTYRTLYINTMDAIRNHLLYRPLIPGDRNVLFTSKMQINPYLAGDSNRETIYEVTHLSCFIGGMVGMGAKLFGLDSDLPIAERLADGCVWAYEATRSGVMPEDARAVPCENPLDCDWDEERYYKYLDPRWALRAGEIEKYDAEKVREEEERQAKARIEKAKEEAEKKEKVLLDEAYGATPRSNGNATKYSLDGTAVKSSEHDVEILENNPPPVNINRKRSFSNSTSTTSDDDALPTLPPYVAPTKTENVPVNPIERSLPKDRSDPYRPLTHEEYISDFLGRNTLPIGFAKVESDKYILRPEAIESVFYMHRISGSPTWPEKGWKMFNSIIAATRTPIGHSAVIGVNREPGSMHKQDSMESFWLAETLKYFYLLYSEPDVVSLDEWVLNTEAHPFRRPS